MTSEGTSIIFTWKSSPAQKKRTIETKDFRWDPPNVPRPYLWPDLPEIPTEISSTIWITEGESDCGVLRHLGIDAFTITRGAASTLPSTVWASLKDRGVEVVNLLFDADPAGLQGAENYRRDATSVGIQTSLLDLSPLLDLISGEKDLRDLWLRVHDIPRVRSLIEGLRSTPASKEGLDRVSLDQFMSAPLEQGAWLVQGVWLQKTVGLIVGSPRIGKSWLALDLAFSIASGEPFLGVYPVLNPGPTVYIAKEDPDYLLYDRVVKLQIAHRRGGVIDNQHRIVFPLSEEIPLYFDLGRQFDFGSGEIEPLLQWLQSIRERHGRVALVIFDPLLRMMSGVDEFKASEVGATVFQAAVRIQKEIGSSVALVHHRAKGQATARGFYGSVAFHAFSENTIFVQGDAPALDGWVGVQGEFKSAAPVFWNYRFGDLSDEYQVDVM
jgi:hypothetical protein